MRQTCSTVSNLDAKVGIARNTSGTALLTGVTDLVGASAAKPITDIGKFTLSGWMLSTATIGDGQYPDLMRKGKWSAKLQHFLYWQLPCLPDRHAFRASVFATCRAI